MTDDVKVLASVFKSLVCAHFCDIAKKQFYGTCKHCLAYRINQDTYKEHPVSYWLVERRKDDRTFDPE